MTDSRCQPSSTDMVEEIRTALAMREAGYQVLFDHETSAELLRRYDEMRKALERIGNEDDVSSFQSNPAKNPRDIARAALKESAS